MMNHIHIHLTYLHVYYTAVHSLPNPFISKIDQVDNRIDCMEAFTLLMKSVHIQTVVRFVSLKLHVLA